MASNRLPGGVFLAVVAVVMLLSSPTSLGFDDEERTKDTDREPTCGFCHAAETTPQTLRLELAAPSDIQRGSTFTVQVTVDASDIDTDEGNLGIFVVDGPTHELPQDHGWQVVADPHGNSVPYNYNRLDGTFGELTANWTLKETSGQLGPRNISVWANYDNGVNVPRYVETQITINVRANMLAEIDTQAKGFFHIFELVEFNAFSTMEDILGYTWDFDDEMDTDSNGNFTDDVQAVGPVTSHKYGLDRQVTVTLTVSNATMTAVGKRTLTIRDYGLFIEGPLKGDCLVCHDTPYVIKDLNPYGEDFNSQVDHRLDPVDALEAIGALDSDGDGFTNQEELDAGTYPGDPTAFPTSIQWVLPADDTFLINQVVTFEARGPDAYTYLWDFGDGFTATGKRIYPGHAYSREGLYTVTLTYGEAKLTRQLTLLNFANLFPEPLRGDCLVCHTTPEGFYGPNGGFNKYGLDYASQPNPLKEPQKALEAVADMDSDGDGVSNRVEIEAGFYPGDPDSVPLPDLRPLKLWVAPESPYEGERVFLYAQVVDDGFFSVYNATADLFIDGHRVWQKDNLTFLSGVPVTLPLATEDLKAGSHTFRVYLDLENAIAEKDEGNNFAQFDFEIAPAPEKEGVPALDLALVTLTLALLAVAWRRRP